MILPHVASGLLGSLASHLEHSTVGKEGKEKVEKVFCRNSQQEVFRQKKEKPPKRLPF
jgi:hypothetical protein